MLNNLKPGFVGRVKKVDYKHTASKRLIDMGITTDTVISLIRIAPFGDPYIIKIRDYLLAIRRADLKAIEFEEVYC